MDINECAALPSVCDSSATCVNNNGSFECQCPDGYVVRNRSCDHINECMSGPCHQNANCTNTVGTFAYACRTGYTGDGFGCIDLNECLLQSCDENVFLPPLQYGVRSTSPILSEC